MTWMLKYMLIMLILQLLMIPIIMNNFHPLNMMIVLITFTTLILMLNNLNSNMSIYSMMIFISMIGGIMIMFLYFVSLINNYKMKINNKEKFLIFSNMLLNLMIMIYLIMMNNPIEEEFLVNNTNMFMMYIYPYNLLTYMSIMYLLYCLIMIMKMCSMKLKPLRKMKN
uniref:NADH dehydrogenase subunit 6 n=1 Tax=Hylaeus confusus TaxID=1190791 RepID=A0A0S2LSN8_9HYME|nr:NADH dehydrogenase subunit 6 [Hylaeus confusus]